MPCSLLYSVADIFEDPHYAARGNLLEMDDAVNGRTVVPAPFPKMTDAEGVVEHLGLPLGACNDDILEGLLKLDPSHIASLKQRGII